MKGLYQEEVTYEEIKFDKEVKQAVKEKKLTSGNDVRIERGATDKDDVYFQHRNVGGMGMRMDEGQFIVSFADGRQAVMSADEFKEKVKPVKEKAKGKPDDGAVGILPLSDGTQQMLTQEQTKKLVDEAADKTAKGKAGNDQGTTNPVK